jgi:hypothetical protein
MEAVTNALVTALLAVLTTAVPILIYLFRAWANAKVVAMEAATLATKATLLAEATKRAAGQVYVEMQSTQAGTKALTAVREAASSVVSDVVTSNFQDTLAQLGGSASTVAGMVSGELGRMLAASPTEALPKPSAV